MVFFRGFLVLGNREVMQDADAVRNVRVDSARWLAGGGAGGQLGSQGRGEFRDAELGIRSGPEFKYRIGLIAGGFLTWPLGSHLDVQPEVLFSQQGASLDSIGLESATIKTDYLVAPILVRYKLRPSNRGLVLFAGPSLGFKLSAKATAESGDQGFTEDISDEVEKLDYGVVFGGGWGIGAAHH